ncbi:MAG: glycosyltransferase family 4 protein [Hyphomicrobiaceae bacterium]
MPRLVFANSVDYAPHTGGWVYNTRVVRELAAFGWDVVPLDLPAGFPRPDAAAIVRSSELFAKVPDGAIVIADQICLSPLAAVVEPMAQRLRLVMIFHHPIAKESGLAEADRARFADLERRALAACRLVVATSPSTSGALVADYGVDRGRIVVAPPGIERHPSAIPPLEADAPRLLSVGAVIPRKGYHLLVEALAGLRERSWRLDIVGDLERAPGYVVELHGLIEVAGLEARVVLRGGLEHIELDESWRRAHVYVGASLHEGYGMAVAEAIARGLPTITTRAGAIGDWLDPAAAIIVSDDSVYALRSAIARVLDEPALRKRLRQAALRQASRFASWADAARTVGERLVQL